MKRTLVAAIVAALIALPTTAGATPSAPEPLGRWPAGPCSDWRYGEYLTSPAKFQATPGARQKVRNLIVCIFDRFAPGNSSTALYVADRESGLYPWAYNASSGCMGLYQHISWDDRVQTFLRQEWFRRPLSELPWSDPRANAIIAARMVRAGGWSPWSL